MIDITKDEFWRNEEVIKKEKKVGGFRKFIIKHKIIFGLIIVLGIMMVANTILIYNFYKILIGV